uniref:Uncharacterized protein n=1 Tax=Glossina morsitans morsitans TaxID=37546 RepID=A0A1B0FMQ6_GLOMM
MVSQRSKNMRFLAAALSNTDCPNTMIQQSMLPNSIRQIDFSGLGAYRFWAETKTSKMEDAEKHSTRDLHMQFNSIQAN